MALLREHQQETQRLQEAHLQVMKSMIEQGAAQTNLIKGYIDFFMTAPKPEVRIMTDVDEAEMERLRNLGRNSAADLQPFMSSPLNQERWLTDMQHTFDDIKGQT